ncbi:MAG TPA: arylsulfotransferase family protein [Solirubrobacteraceae bacterium]|nr:arylsulfotransferase family protein [Solirubrobacteraceae bacterium]
MSTTDRPPWGDAEDDLALHEEFGAARRITNPPGADETIDEVAPPERELPRRRPVERPRRSSPPRRRAGVTRRQWMRRAVASSLGLSAAGFVGYELHPAAETHRAESSSEKRAAPAGARSGSALSTEAQSFLTRPDLKPPAVKVTHFATTDTTPSYILLSVTNVIPTDAIQQGLMMIDRQGRLIWFQPIASPDKPFDFNAFSVQGKPALTWWQGRLASSHGVGVGIAIDSAYGQLQKIRAGHGLQTDLHELNITSHGTALVTAYQLTNANLTSIGGSSSHPIFCGHAQEIELSSGKVLFDWSSLDHVAVDETYMGKPAGNEVLDYFHINSVGETSDGNLLISGRNTSALYKVDRHSGKVIWRLGGKRSDFSFGSDANFHWQHDGRAWSDTLYTVFDNGAMGSEARSRGLLLNVDESAGSVSLVQEYLHPAAFVSPALGSVTRLNDGRIFVGWGDQPYFSEFDSGGAMLLDGQLPVGVRSYRAFTVDWVGKPSGKPAVVARQNPAGGFVIRASWNGATEIARWQVLGGPSPSRLMPVGDQIWTGFETAIAVNSDGPSFQAVALDSSGRELGRSDVV